MSMGVIRVPHNENFTTMSNYHLRDKQLSLRAVGLMSKMLSLPDDWDYTVSGLASICREGREAVRKVLQELETAGYLEREQSRGGSGTFAGYDYTLHEMPRAVEDAGPYEEADGSPSPLPGNPGDGEAPLPKNPEPGNPVPGFPPQVNTDNQRKTNIPPIVPQRTAPAPDQGRRKRRRREAKAAPDWKPERFAAFWSAYPRGESKQAAIAAWDALKPDEDLLHVMALALKRQMQSRAWKDGIGIPYASTWINGRRWEDEVKGAPAEPEEPERNGGYDLWT